MSGLSRNAAAALLLILTGLVLSVSGCSIDYQQGTLDESLKGEIPDFIMYNVRETDVQEKGRRVTLSAERAEDYRSIKETRFFNVNFRESSETGETMSEGHVDFGRLKDSKDAELKGNIRIDSRSNEAKVEADELVWTHEKKNLTAPNNGRVYLLRDNGSSLEGTGFNADFRNDVIDFSGGVEGTLTTDPEPVQEAAP